MSISKLFSMFKYVLYIVNNRQHKREALKVKQLNNVPFLNQIVGIISDHL